MSTGLCSHTESASSYYTKQRRDEQEDTQEWCSDLTFHVASAWNFACMAQIRLLALTQNYLLVSYSLLHTAEGRYLMHSATCCVVTEKLIADVLHTCGTWDKSGEESAR